MIYVDLIAEHWNRVNMRKTQVVLLISVCHILCEPMPTYIWRLFQITVWKLNPIIMSKKLYFIEILRQSFTVYQNESKTSIAHFFIQIEDLFSGVYRWCYLFFFFIGTGNNEFLYQSYFYQKTTVQSRFLCVTLNQQNQSFFQMTEGLSHLDNRLWPPDVWSNVWKSTPGIQPNNWNIKLYNIINNQCFNNQGYLRKSRNL